MSSTPSAAPSSAPPASAEPVVEVPEIADVRKGFARWIWGTISGTARGVKNAISAVTWRPTKYVFRKVYNGLIAWPLNYAKDQLDLLTGTDVKTGKPHPEYKGTRLWKGLKFAIDPENYRLYGGGRGHGGGEAAAH